MGAPRRRYTVRPISHQFPAGPYVALTRMDGAVKFPVTKSVARVPLLSWFLVGPLAEPDAGPFSILVDELDSAPNARLVTSNVDRRGWFARPAILMDALLPGGAPSLKIQRKYSEGDHSS
jgi:hypothetical protein